MAIHPHPGAQSHSSHGTSAQDAIHQLLIEISLIDKELRRNRLSNLPRSTRMVFDLLARFGPMTVPQLARKCESTRQNIQIIVNRLKKQGFIEMENNPAHKRSPLATLTPRSSMASESVREAEAAATAVLVQGLEVEELERATALLGIIRDRLAQGSRPKARTKAEEKSQAEATVAEDPAGLPVSLL